MIFRRSIFIIIFIDFPKKLGKITRIEKYSIFVIFLLKK
jgi:hypothetical protein